MSITLINGESRFIQACADSLQDSDLGKNYFPSRDKAEEAIKEFLNNGNFLVAVDEDQSYVGFICYLPTGAFHAFPYLHLLVTSGIMRGRGIGSKIMDKFEELVFSKNDKLFLAVADFNHKGKEFYKKRGFKEIGTIPSLYRDGIDECLMMKVKGREGR